jgi:hypothetical protein
MREWCLVGSEDPERGSHTGCNCRRTFGVTQLEALDVLVNCDGFDQNMAARLLWDFQTPIANSLAVEYAGLVAREYARAEFLASFPWLRGYL